MAKRGANISLVIIDPQNDFCDIPGATLPVPGADADMKRTATLVRRVGHKLNRIGVTLDSHRRISIERPTWWMNQSGQQPAPFTIISAADIEASIWTPKNPGYRAKTLAYARALEATPNHYKICAWPPHCHISTPGHNVHSVLADALKEWEEKEYANVDYVTKGSNPFTEHYGALMAEVPDPDDPSTGLNTEFLRMLAEADIIAVAGEASSHCVLKTLGQIADNIGNEHLKKFHLLEDCMSPVPAIPNVVDFPAMAEAGLKDMARRGMVRTNSVDFLS
jgi:nicotinamidase/pyrazinamidase